MARRLSALPLSYTVYAAVGIDPTTSRSSGEVSLILAAALLFLVLIQLLMCFLTGRRSANFDPTWQPEKFPRLLWLLPRAQKKALAAQRQGLPKDLFLVYSLFAGVPSRLALYGPGDGII